MSYQIIIKRQVKRKLQSLPKTDRLRIVEKIQWLGKNPDDDTLDIKKLVGQSFYRLRVGNWRVIFSRDDKVRIIAIDKLKPRGDVYK